jgi:hypothetical protein
MKNNDGYMRKKEKKKVRRLKKGMYGKNNRGMTIEV